MPKFTFSLCVYFKINVEPRLSRISGVGNVNVMGGDYAMRIWMNPQKMAQYQLVPADVIALLDDQNVEAATGTLGEDSENTFSCDDSGPEGLSSG